MLLPHRSHFSLSLEIIFSSSLKFSLVNKYSSISTKKKKTTRPWEVYNAAFAHASVITLYSQSSGVIGSCLRSSLARLTDYPAVPACPYFACGPVSISSSSAHTPASPLTGGSTFTRTLLHWFSCLPHPNLPPDYMSVCIRVWGMCPWVQMSSEARSLDPLGWELQTIVNHPEKPKLSPLQEQPKLLNIVSSPSVWLLKCPVIKLYAIQPNVSFVSHYKLHWFYICKITHTYICVYVYIHMYIYLLCKNIY